MGQQFAQMVSQGIQSDIMLACTIDDKAISLLSLLLMFLIYSYLSLAVLFDFFWRRD